MAKGAWIGIGDKARKIKKSYVGINGVARKIKKMWIGVGNVARLFWSGAGEISYYGRITSKNSYENPAYASVGNYALVGCNNYSNTIDSISTSLTVGSAPVYHMNGGFGVSAASNSSLAVFGGGYGAGYYTRDGSAYNASLTKSTIINIYYSDFMYASTISSSAYALFIGGEDPDDDATSQFSGVNTSGTCIRSSVKHGDGDTYYVKCKMAGTMAGSNYIFGGGQCGTSYNDTSGSNRVFALNSSLTPITTTGLYFSTYKTGWENDNTLVAAASVGDYALFAGGSGEYYTDDVTMDIFNSSLTRSTKTFMYCYHLKAVSIEGYAIFAGRVCSPQLTSTAAYDETVYIFDESLTLTTKNPSIGCRVRSAAVPLANQYALFGYGTFGFNSYSPTNSIDVFQLV